MFILHHFISDGFLICSFIPPVHLKQSMPRIEKLKGALGRRRTLGLLGRKSHKAGSNRPCTTIARLKNVVNLKCFLFIQATCHGTVQGCFHGEFSHFLFSSRFGAIRAGSETNFVVSLNFFLN